VLPDDIIGLLHNRTRMKLSYLLLTVGRKASFGFCLLENAIAYRNGKRAALQVDDATIGEHFRAQHEG